MRGNFYTTLIVLLLICASHPAGAQDIIIKRNGDTLTAKVLKVTPFAIEYRKDTVADTGRRAMAVTDIALIRYPSGHIDSFKEEGTPVSLTHNRLMAEERARGDARLYFKGYREAKTTSAILSVLSPLYGIVFASISASTRPKEHNLNYPFPSKARDEVYRNAYNTEAWKIKRKKVWGGVAIGTTITLSVYAAVMVVVYNASH